MAENAINTPIARVRTTDRRDRSTERSSRARAGVASEYGSHANRYVRHRYHLQDLRGPDRARAATRATLGRGSRRGRGRDRRAGRGTLRERERGSMGRIDEDDEDARGTRARGMRWMGKNSCRRTRWVDRRARGRPRATRGTTTEGDGRDRGRSIRERILDVDRFGWMRV